MRGFACQRCRRPVLDSWQQYTERVELRSIDGKRRAFVATTSYICKSCIPERVAEIRGEVPSNVAQIFEERETTQPEQGAARARELVQLLKEESQDV